jgi:hypothetical protein
VIARAAFLLLIGSVAVMAHDPITTKLTWSQEISRIVYKRCAGCHKDAGSAMPLLTYEQARPWAKAIRDEVLNRRMPPWGAVKGFGDFQKDASLTQEEITRLAQWVEGGAPEGDPAYLPPLPRPAEPHPLPAGVRVRRIPASSSVVVLGIRPLVDVEQSKISAHLPSGIIEPLIWLREYKQKWSRTFLFRAPLKLPAGTKIVADPAVPYELLISHRKPR